MWQPNYLPSGPNVAPSDYPLSQGSHLEGWSTCSALSLNLLPLLLP